MRTLTFEINKEDCVGDSVGKHNYNTLSLDTAICNLSSNIYNVFNNIKTIFDDISANSPRYIQAANNFSDEGIVNYNITHTTINLLSSYWNTSEFTVQYEYDLYSIDNQNNLSNIASTFNAYTTATSAITLINSATNYLSSNFPADSFNLKTRANVVVMLYNTVNVTNISNVSYAPVYNAGNVEINTLVNAPNAALMLLDDYNVPVIDFGARPTAPYNRGYTLDANNNLTVIPTFNRSIRVDFLKQDVRFVNAFIAKYTVDSVNGKKKWTLINYLRSDETTGYSRIYDTVNAYNS